ncbi:MAG TPA: DUF502 domain-containing protein [Gammaproteobacteria bacterium]|nr:DUF502 domain-containing protein [Gammaproteobacteria bacterium]
MSTRTVRSIFFSGLIAVLPAIATIYLVVWLVMGFEAALGTVLRYALPAERYVPGMGLLAGLGVVFVVGLAMQAWLGRELWNLGEKLLRRMPLVSQIFGAVKEIVTYVSGSAQPSGNAVVAVKLGEPPVRMLGLVTRDSLEFLDSAPGDEQVAVFLPWSYQVGGFTVFVSRRLLEPVDLTPREALRLSLTAGVMQKAPGA